MSIEVCIQWGERFLSDIADVIDPHPSHRAPSIVNNGIPFAGIGDLDESGTIIRENVRKVSEGVFEEHQRRYRITSQTIGFGRVASIGKVIDFNEFDKKVTISPTMAIIEPNEVDKIYLVNALRSHVVSTQIRSLLTGSTRASLGIALLRRLKIPLPPLPEQKKIAEVLGSVDAAIATTEAVIAQTRRVKQGLLTDLLTKGIGHTKFKQTDLGQIPESWDVVRLETLLVKDKVAMRSGPFGSALKKAELVSDGIPFLGIDNVQKEHFVSAYKRFVTKQKFDALRRYSVFEGDVMITIMGTVGRCCVVPPGIGDALSSKHIWTMSFDRNQYFPELICWQLNYARWVLSAFQGEAQGGIMSAINSKVLRNLKLPLPSIDEQRQMAAILNELNSNIHIEQTKLEQLKRVKKGLMAALLTGKKRVMV